jgi:radical SAM superfamily enzyme YgiQ (UPF0313 family)
MKRGKPRLRNPEKIADELKYLKEKFDINSIFVYDDELIGMSENSNKWLIDICNEIGIRDIHHGMWFKGQGRCSEKYINEDVLDHMRGIGFFAMMMGCESGSEEVKKIIKKGTSNEDIRYTLNTLSKWVDIYGFWMIGMPGETSAEARKTEELIYELAPRMKWIQVTIFSPLPGSDFWDEALDNGWLNGHIIGSEERFVFSIENVSKNFQMNAVLDMPWMNNNDIKKWQTKLYSAYNAGVSNGRTTVD